MTGTCTGNVEGADVPAPVGCIAVENKVEEIIAINFTVDERKRVSA